MVSLDYEDIFSWFRGLVTDFNMLKFDPKDLEDIEKEKLHRAISNPRVTSLFSSLSLNDDTMVMEFELYDPIDDLSDRLFIQEVLANGMAIAWYQPQVDSVLNVAPMIGGKEEKTLLNNHKYSIERLNALEIERQKIIRDRGYSYYGKNNKST